MTDEAPDDARLCECGHPVEWYIRDQPEVDARLGVPEGSRMAKNIEGHPCAHNNGTVLETCPKCKRWTGIWGPHEAVGECECWDRAAEFAVEPVWPFRKRP